MSDPRVTGKYAVPTKANTEFMDWWQLLNDEMAERGWKQVGYRNAKDCWEMGESPQTAAQQLMATIRALLAS